MLHFLGRMSAHLPVNENSESDDAEVGDLIREWAIALNIPKQNFPLCLSQSLFRVKRRKVYPIV
jgi:hypothetical protein